MSGIDPIANTLRGQDDPNADKKSELKKVVEKDIEKAKERTAEDISLFKELEVRKDLVDATKNGLTWQGVNDDIVKGEEYRASLGIGVNLDTSA